MIITHYAIIALVGLTPILLFFSNFLLDGIVELYAAVALASVALSIHPGEASHWIKTIRRATWLAALPLLWTVIQLLPIPSGGISSSIWQTAAAALDTRLLSSMTIDPGLTILAACRYASMVVIGSVAAAVAIERQQSERLFLALGCAMFVISLIAIVFILGGLASTDVSGERIRSGAIAGSIDGVVLFAAIIIMVVERHFTRRNSQDFLRQFVVPLIGAIVGFLICSLATMMAASGQAIFAAVCGLVTVGIVQFVRRIGLGGQAALAMAGVAILGAAVIVLTKATPAISDLSSRYAAHPSADRVSVFDRIIGEVGFAGSGAGTFDAIYRLYAPQDTAVAPPLPPTTAAEIAIELGRPALWFIVALTIALVMLCARGGFNRGRDFFYSTAGAGMLVATLVWAFCDIGLNNAAVSILLVVTLGLTLAQSVSRTL